MSFIVLILSSYDERGKTQPQSTPNPANPETKVEKMFEYGYRKSNYGPDELVTDAHGNPSPWWTRCFPPRSRRHRNRDAAPVLLLAAYSRQHRFGHPPVRSDRHDPAFVEPLGFNLRDTKLRRAGLDYHDMAHVVLHPNFDNLVESMPTAHHRVHRARHQALHRSGIQADRHPLFGPEPGDIPDPMDIMEGPHVAEQVRLPMRPSLRSLNLTNCASIAIYEAWRQLNFAGGA
ncbi:MAG: tRNA (cytidine(34)-2'-O)-methyltransferase [Bifidobacterium dentium]